MQDTERSAKDEGEADEVVSGGSAAWDIDAFRPRYSYEEKALIVQESFEHGATVDEVAERHGVPPRRLSYWRKLTRKGELPAAGSEGAFAAVEVAPPAGVDAGSVSIEARGVTVRITSIACALRPRHACRLCEQGVTQAPAPAHLIEGALARRSRRPVWNASPGSMRSRRRSGGCRRRHARRFGGPGRLRS